jgi:hypothetical protein
MWVKGPPFHFIVYSGSHKNLISAEAVKWLDLPMTLHLQTYTIGWLHQERDIYGSQQCRLPYDIKPFKDEVLFDISPLEVFNVILEQSYFWKHHALYESRPHSVIITLGRQLYRILEVVPPTTISLISSKKCSKVISQTEKFILFVIHSHNKKKVFATFVASTQHLILQQKQVEGIVEEYRDIFSSHIGYRHTSKSSIQLI